MPKADSVRSTLPTDTSAVELESFAAPAATLDRWHEATERLVNILMRVSGHFALVRESHSQDDRNTPPELITR